MYIKKMFLLTLLLSGLLFLVACAADTPAEPTNEPVTPPETEEQNPYPYPEPGKEVIRPTEPTEPYPDPEFVVITEPYPGTEDSGSAQDPRIILITDNFLPVSIDKDFNRGPVFIDSTDIVLEESQPGQVQLVLTGNLPTPCHRLRVVTSDPDKDGQIDVEIYSVSDPEKMCIQVLSPFEAIIPLGDYTEGNRQTGPRGHPG